MDVAQIKTEEDVKRFLAGWSDFERAVYLATFKIPEGMVSTYGRIAEKIGRPNAYRAVANALHKNPLHPVVPCHRVVTADGRFGGNKKRADDRRKLVESEDVPIENGKVKMGEDIIF
ncbi:MAG: MGMT family protein [Candidatus Thorarchaeota archaeon]